MGKGRCARSRSRGAAATMTVRRRARALALAACGLVAGQAWVGATPDRGAPRLVFPVLGRAAYGHDFGQPRPQGPHRGTDILARRRAVAVAAEAGTVRLWTRSPAAGCMLYLNGESGTTYLYVHLDNDLGPGNDNRGGCAPGVAYALGLRRRRPGGGGRGGGVRGQLGGRRRRPAPPPLRDPPRRRGSRRPRAPPGAGGAAPLPRRPRADGDAGRGRDGGGGKGRLPDRPHVPGARPPRRPSRGRAGPAARPGPALRGRGRRRPPPPLFRPSLPAGG